jgi:hypothetical protein
MNAKYRRVVMVIMHKEKPKTTAAKVVIARYSYKESW